MTRESDSDDTIRRDFDFWDEYFDEQGNYDPLKKNHPPTRWKQKDGKIVQITELDDRHIENIIKLLERRGKKDSPVYKSMISERNRRIRALTNDDQFNVFILRKPENVIKEGEKKRQKDHEQ